MSNATKLLVLAVLAIALTACTGDDDAGGAFTGAEVRRIAQIAPVTPGWPVWPARPDAKKPSGKTPEDFAEEDPIFAEYYEKTRDIPIADEDGTGNTWSDDDKLANFTAEAFADADDAHTILLASNDLSRGYAETHGFVTDEGTVEGLGDEAWRVAAEWNGTQVTYHWRRDNVVAEAHVHCFGDCPDDVDAAARSWAEAIDAELVAARAASG